MNTKYISSNVLKISVISRVRRRVKLLIFSTHNMKYFWYLPKKKFFFPFREKTFFPSHFSIIMLGSARLMGRPYNIGWKCSLHLENGL